MAISITRQNTTISDLGGGWIKVTHDTGAEILEATITRASIEISKGVLLPQARIKDIAYQALVARQSVTPLEIATAL